ncbi:MAG: type II toxin-antitoxin system Phd/YefM family antitoxin [Chitinophagaceae bacterium]|nr:MAG: type II toxin-antitoxin system Phd/YefM family antitoxin [Chitinophagaceae bacterium]
MPKLATLPDTASVQDMQRNYRKLLDRVKLTRAPMFILRNNMAEVVIVDAKSWDEIAKKIAKLEEDELFESVQEARQEFKSGKAKVLKGKLSDLMK